MLTQDQILMNKQEFIGLVESINREGADIPLPTQNEAAMLAVYHSSQKGNAKVEVDYTFVKNIRKTKN